MTSRVALARGALVGAAAVAAVVLVGFTGYQLVTARTWGDAVSAFWECGWLGFCLVGGLLVFRRPDEPIGRLLSLVGVFGAATYVGAGWANHDISSDSRVGVLVTVAALTYTPAFVLSFACVIAIVLTYPTGRVDTRLRRIGALMAQVGAAVMVLAYLLRRRLQVAEGSWVRNPLHPRWLAGVPEAVIAVAAVALLAASALAIVSAVRTFRRSTGVERQQMRWFAWSALAMPAVFVFGVALGSLDQTVSNWVCFVAIVVGLNAIAVAIGIAVSRYRLYDIDRVVSRTIAYAAVSGVVVGGYVGLVALSESVLGFSSEITVAASTLTAAALFQPLRRHVQRNVDRRFDRTAYDARRTVDAFSTRLRDEVDVDTVTNDLLDTASSAVAPSRVSLWLVPA